MAGETITMIKLKQIFLLRQNGANISTIAQNVNSSRNTIKKYLRLVENKGIPIEELIKKEEYQLEKLFAEPVKCSKKSL